MKTIDLALPMTVAFLFLMGVPVPLNFAAEGSGPVTTEGKNEEATMPRQQTKKILIAYFSNSGNTREIADQIHRKVGGDLFEIQPVKPYPHIYEVLTKQAKEELASGTHPALKADVENMGSYDVVFIGHPIWWGTFPAPVRTFLSAYDFSGKTLVPFCTHAGSGQGHSVTDISKLCPRATLLEGIAILGSDAKVSQNEVLQWLRRIKLAE